MPRRVLMRTTIMLNSADIKKTMIVMALSLVFCAVMFLGACMLVGGSTCLLQQVMRGGK